MISPKQSVAWVLVPALVCAGAFSGGCFLPPADCLEGMEVGDTLVLHVIEPYTPESRFAWNQPAGSPLPPSCGALGDISTPMTISVTFVRRVRTGSSCNMFAAVPDSIAGVDVIDPGERVDLDEGFGMLGSVSGACENRWRMSARAHGGRADVIGVQARDGQLPPLVVTRTVQGACFGPEGMGCADFFVGELHRE